MSVFVNEVEKANPVPRTYVHGFGTLPFGKFHNIHPRTHVRGVLSFDLPVRQAHGPEAHEGEAPDRWAGQREEPSKG